MLAGNLRKLTVAAGVFTALVATAGRSDGCCFWKSATTAYYAPAPVVAPAPVCNTCNYVPQVAYRTVYTNVPVTTYRPITGVNPCTGCPTTALQPVTTYRMQAQLVPYTTYRPIPSPCGCATPTTVSYAPATCPTGTCGAAVPAATTYYAPAAVAPATVAPAAPCCGGASATVAPMASTYASAAPAYPTAQSYAATPGNSATPSYPAAGSWSAANGGSVYGSPAASSIPASRAPSLPPAAGSPAPASGAPGAPTPQTFKNDAPANDPAPSSTITPIPDYNTSSTPRANMVVPRLGELDDLQTAKPLPGGGVYRYASAKVVTTTDDGGWRAASR